ncbi:stage V sporulation protein D [Desulfurispora thermophila]|uniref:stage V sporulation protein D n=1 Tax=Desulfurispora thermophila TaxID=265470 RepID=UPI00037436F4|nr:stage V sporulation protein D [Desulfurispora thermophila]
MRSSAIIRKRLTWLFFIMAGLMGVLLLRLVWITGVQSDELRRRAEEVRMKDIPVEARRGNIYDRNGRELVTSISADSVYAVPYRVKDPAATARALAGVLDMDAGKLERILSRRSGYEWIKRKITPEQSYRVRQLALPGIYLVEESVRLYPHATLAAHLLGYSGVDNQGLAGLEKTFDQYLKGTDGRILVEHDAAGRELPDPQERFIAPRQGHSLVLALDENIQYFVERELDRVVARYQPRLAVIAVMDPASGEVLAMGSRPTYDANQWKTAPPEVRDRNPAVWYNYEPGSTFKIITAAAALNEKVVQENDRFYDPGYASVADRRIRCWKPGGHGSQSFTEVVMNSCNPGFIEVGLRLGKERFYNYLQAFGFGHKTGLGLPGEARGIVIPEQQATNLNLATMSIGQSIAVTPIQLLTAVCAVANGGTLYEPHLVKQVRDAKGQVVKTFAPRPLGRVIQPATSTRLAALLEKVVALGTGRNAFVEGYRVAGKTGTAQVVGEQGGYVSGRYVASFVGFAPVEKPRFAMLVMIAEPQGGIYYGGQVAAPVFQSVARDILHYLNVPADPALTKPRLPHEWQEKPAPRVTVPDVVNRPLGEADRLLREAGLRCRVSGSGPVVLRQVPRAGVEMLAGQSVLLEMEPLPQKSDVQVTVPNLSNLTRQEAGQLLQQLGLVLVAEGSGLVVEQQPAPGRRVARGSQVRVQCAPPGRPLQPVVQIRPVLGEEWIAD